MRGVLRRLFCWLALMVGAMAPLPLLAGEPAAEKGRVVSAQEARQPAYLKLVKRFAPCLAVTGGDIWPVLPSYQWHNGSPLMRGLLRADGQPENPQEVLSASVLSQRPWHTLPSQAPGGQPYVYYIDGPGENLGPGEEDASWITEWRRIQGSDPVKAAYPPTVLVQGLWLPPQKNGKRLVLRYWFFYPYDKWSNSHESDWEHIEVLLEGGGGKTPFEGAWRLSAVQFHFHSDEVFLSPQEFYVVGPRNEKEGRHPVVFVGGQAGSMVISWKGLYSGASYPWPALYNYGPVTDDTRVPRRYIHAEDLAFEFLLNPAEMDYTAKPYMSWFNLDVRLGQPRVKYHPVVAKQGGDSYISHPGRRLGGWATFQPVLRWHQRHLTKLASAQFPADWKVLSAPPADVVKKSLASP